MRNLLQDLRYALRQLRQSPAFALIAMLTLALGIGANTAIFSVMNAMLLRALPVAHPENLYTVHEANGQEQPDGATDTGNPGTSFSEPVFEALRQRGDVFADLIASAPLSLNKVAVRQGETPEEAEADEVSGNFFSGLSVAMARGRGFTRSDELSHASVLVLSYDYWTRRFARNPDVLGTTLYVKGVPLTVIGIAAHGFQGVEPASSTDFWIPLQTRPELNAWGMPADSRSLYGSPTWWDLRMIARLGPGVTPEKARIALSGTFREAAKTSLGSLGANWKPLLDFVPARGISSYSEAYREPVQVLMGLVLMVLLIAVTNVAMMLVARNTARQREFSVRLALGAGKRRLFSQLLAESLLLVGAGTALGWVFAVYATRLLAYWSEIESGLSPDRSVLLFTLCVSVTAAVAFGLAPLWTAMRAPVTGVLRAGATQVSGSRRRAFAGKAVMAVQVAVCLVLLVAAGLLLRTLRHYQTQDLGMRTAGLVAFGIAPQNVHGQGQTLEFYQRLLDRVRALPRVESAALAENRPGTGWSDNTDMSIDGAQQRGVLLRTNVVSPNFFHTLGTPLLLGRDFGQQDTAASPLVVLVNETFSKRFFPRSNPLGHHIGSSAVPKPATIVGVVRDSKYTSVDENPMPMAYVAYTQMPSVGAMQVEVRTAAEPLAMLPAVRRAVQELDENLPLEQPMTQQAQFEKSYAQPKMFATLGGFFGALSAVLVATGLYGTLLYRTARRSTEIGIRMALGAQREQVLWLVLRESLVVVTAGAAVGLPLALFCTRFLQSMLYQLSPFDPISVAAAAGCVVLVVALASWMPARRATSIEPVEALRAE